MTNDWSFLGWGLCSFQSGHYSEIFMKEEGHTRQLNCIYYYLPMLSFLLSIRNCMVFILNQSSCLCFYISLAYFNCRVYLFVTNSPLNINQLWEHVWLHFNCALWFEWYPYLTLWLCTFQNPVLSLSVSLWCPYQIETCFSLNSTIQLD